MWRTFCFTLFLVTGSRQLSMTNFAVPPAVPAGESAELRCEYKSEADLSIKWWWTPLDGDVDKRELFYQHIPGHNYSKPSFNIKIKDNGVIELLDLKPKNSGLYECEVGLIDELRQHQELIVYSKGSGPQLNVSTVADGPDEDDEEDVLITCSASDVAPEPKMNITIDGETVSLQESVNKEADGLYSVAANATVSKGRAQDALISCKLFYENHNILHPGYIDALTYDPSADGSNQLGTSWLRLLAVTVPINLLIILV